MDRRAFISTMAGGLLAAPLAAEAQSPAQAPRIGFLWGGAPSPSTLRDLEDGLRERGWVSGQNITIEHRAAGAVASACRSSPPSWSRRG